MKQIIKNQEYENGYFEWGDGSFSKAKREGRLVFVRSDGQRIPIGKK